MQTSALHHQTLADLFGFAAFRPGQEAAINSLLAGEHTLVVMPTGAGKSLVYQLVAMQLPAPAVTLVVSPLIALMKDQVDSLQRNNIPATFINSSLSGAEQTQRISAVLNGAYRLVYVAPERLRSGGFQQALRRMQVGLLVIDEAHCISHWGHDFRPDYRRIAQAREVMGRPLTAALTATATTLVQDDIVELLGIPAAQRIVTGFNRPNLSFEVGYASDNAAKLQLLAGLLADFRAAPAGGTAIIYAGTRRNTEEVTGFINAQTGISADYYHAGLPPGQRSAVQDAFLRGELPVVVATNAFGMGIDRADVRLVAHYSLPGTLEAYYQEAGRAGRDGLPARAVLLYAPQDRILQQWFIGNNNTQPTDLRRLYRALGNSQSEVQVSLDELARRTGGDSVKARTGLAHLERAGVVQRHDDDGAILQLTVEAWDDAAVAAITSSLTAYERHRQRQLDQMTEYAETDGCRRQVLLSYFSDDGPAEAEYCCDNCTVQQTTTPATQDVASLPRAQRAALVILAALQKLQWGIGRKRLAELLKGSKAKSMTGAYTQHPYYGRFAEFSLGQIEALIEQLVVQGYLKIVGGDRPVLQLSRRGSAALAARAAIPLELPESPAPDADASSARREYSAGSSTVDETAAHFARGLSPAAIATERGITEQTVYKHLAALIGEGRLTVDAVVAADVIAAVHTAIDAVGDLSKLSPLKERLPAYISYEELRCVVEDVRRRRAAAG